MLHPIKSGTSKMLHPIIKLLLFYIAGLLLIACGGSGGSNSGNGALQLSGTINIQRDSDVDLDLNSSTSLNNDINNPQIISNPSTIGGYLSGYSGTYSHSTILTFNEDLVDYFTVELVEGQELQLSVFQADSALNTIDFELSLLDESQQTQASLQIDEFSSSTLRVPADGSYTLALSVGATTSPLLYTLSLSQTITAQSFTRSEIKTLSQDFIPGEVLLSFKNTKKALIVQQSYANAKSSQLNKSAVKQDPIAPLLDKLVAKVTLPSIATVYQLPSINRVGKASQYNEPEIAKELNFLESKIQTLELIKQLNASELVEFAEPNFIYRTAVTGLASPTDDPRFSDQWNLPMLSTPAAWQVASGEGVVVAVLDTGINPSHEDLVKNIHVDGYDFISDTKSSGDGDGPDSNANDEGTSFHGSHVAGIIAAEADNSIGVAGLAYNAKVMPLRVLGVQGTGSSSDIAQAILYAAGLNSSLGDTEGQSPRADIINMSFGSDAQSSTLKAALDQAYGREIILIAAAGNAATDKAFYPAAYDNVIGVGAVSNDKKRSSFSNFGINVDLVAPGGTGSGSASYDGFQDAILSTVNGNNYAEYIGTSMAAPHVSAVAALVKQLKGDLTGQSFKTALEAGYLTHHLTGTTSDINNFYGKGLIDAAKAVNWATGGSTIPGILSVYPTKFGFNGGNTKAELSLTNPSSGSIKINTYESQQNWLNIQQDNVDSNGLGTYLVEVNLSQVSLGQGAISIYYQIDDGPEQQLTLNAFVSRSVQSDPDIGNLLVSLYKEEDVLNDVYQRAYGIPAQRKNGAYEFCFNNVASGRYLLTASTDHDGDNIFPFDEGEAVGSFPLLSRPSFIEINSKSLTDINFDIQYPSFSSSISSMNILREQNLNVSNTFSAVDDWGQVAFTSQSACSR